MTPSASSSAYPFPDAELGGKAFWVPPVRQTGFLQSAAILNVGTSTHRCPCAISELSTLSTKPSLELFSIAPDDFWAVCMPPPRFSKARVNENKHPYVVELAVVTDGMDVELSRQIVRFHKSRHIQL